MIEYALKLIDRNGMEGVVKHELVIEKQIKFYNGRIETVKEWNENIMNIFMAKKGKKLSFSIENPDKNKVKKEIENNVKILKMLESSGYSGIQDKKNYVDKKLFDINVIDNEKMIEIAEDAIEKGGKAGVVFSRIDKIEIGNTNGVRENDKNSMVYLSVRAFYRNSSSHEVSCSRSINEIDASVAENAYKIAKETTRKIKIKEGRYNILFYPMAFANIISNMVSFSSAFYVDAGYSFLKDKIGKRIGSEILSIYDDGTAIDGIASRKFDDEGNATQRTCIVKNGVLENYLHNSETANLYGEITTGNAGIMVPHPWNILVEGENATIGEIMEDFEGIVITNLWYTRFQNYRKGDFSTVARDAIFYVKNGDKKSIKRARISENMEELLKKIKILSDEKKQIFWWEVETPVFSPYAVAENVRITLP